MTNAEIEQEIISSIEELMNMSKTISELEPVSHISKSPIRFQGGIIGIVQDVRENKRLEKLINAPIYKDKSFYNISFIIVTEVERLVNLQQQLIVDDVYTKAKIQSIGEMLVKSFERCVAIWYNYSPTMAMEEVNIGDGKYQLGPSVQLTVREKLSKMDLPAEYDYLKDKTQPKSGCLSMLIILCISSIEVLGITGYGLTHLLG